MSKKLLQDLNKRFAAPLPEFYKHRIIFWYDEDKEFEDKLDGIQVDNAKLLVLTGTNYYAAKKLLNVDDTTSNYLVYNPISYESHLVSLVITGRMFVQMSWHSMVGFSNCRSRWTSTARK